ncbi:MAG: radical SAM protein [Oscillospiraceae bacterium]|nr:radical SAM protein [Oscillospiraceae bacterium]
MLKKAYVEITNRCNLSCAFCPKTARSPRSMSVEEFDLVLGKLGDAVQYVYLHVMGEPLGHAELGGILAAAAARGKKVCITTNGTLLEKRRDLLLAAPTLHKVSVSLHSFEGNDLP